MFNSDKLPKLVDYDASDGNKLSYRYYRANEPSEKVIILMHGICEDSKYLQPLASYLSEQGLAHVITPDLRGYGEKTINRGDLDYIGQLEADIAVLIDVIKQHEPYATIILAGHSAGGGTALRFAASSYADSVDRYLLISPFIHFQAPIMKESNANTAHISRLIRLMIYNGFGYKKKNHLPVLTGNKPEEQCHGSETLTLSYRLFMSRLPNDYKKALSALPEDTLLLIGEQDEQFKADAYQPLLAKYSKTNVEIIAHADHDGILSNKKAFEIIKRWI